MVRYDGLTKAEVLCALYNNAVRQRHGIYLFKNAKMTVKEAESLLTEQTYFDYIYDRFLYVDLSGDKSFDETSYDACNGEYAAQTAVDDYKLEKNFVNNL